MVYIESPPGGGGQILRSALALSLLTGQELHITNIRLGRPKPGLMAQHLQSVDAAAAVGKAEVRGAALHSQQLFFRPTGVRSGRYKFEIGTAGATSLVLQTIFLPLSRAESASTVIISGGTHVNWSPSFHYLELNWLPYLKEMGFDLRLSLDQAGFYPEGGGRITATIRPAQAISPLHITERGKLLRIRGISAVANLDQSIADRQKRQALRRLEGLAPGVEVKIKTEQLPAPFKGTLLLLLAEFEGSHCCYDALGAKGKPAEAVADEAVDGLAAFLQTDGAIDERLADQLLLPLSQASGPSEIRTSRVTDHLLTNAAVIRAFLPVQIDIQGLLGEPALVRIIPA